MFMVLRSITHLFCFDLTSYLQLKSTDKANGLFAKGCVDLEANRKFFILSYSMAESGMFLLLL